MSGAYLSGVEGDLQLGHFLAYDCSLENATNIGFTSRLGSSMAVICSRLARHDPCTDRHSLNSAAPLSSRSHNPKT